jgi:hypothetical protein
MATAVGAGVRAVTGTGVGLTVVAALALENPLPHAPLVGLMGVAGARNCLE